MRAAWALLLLIPLAGCVDESPAADLVIVDATIWSPDKPLGFATDVAVRGSEIVYLGKDASHHIGTSTQVVDLDGQLLLPGFRDSHMHPFEAIPLKPQMTFSTAQEQLQADLENHATQVAYHGGRHVRYQAGDFTGDDPAEYEYCAPVNAAGVSAERARLASMEQEMVRQGITTVIEAGLDDLTRFVALQEREAAGESLIRWLIRVKDGCYEQLDAMGVEPHTGDWVRWHGVKLYGDGYMGSWVAALASPYSDRPGWSGVLVHTEPALDHLIARAQERGLHIGTHAIGDATIHQVLDAYERAGIQPDDRWTIEHVQVTSPEIIARFSELGAIPSIQLSFATTDQRMAADRLGDRLPDAYDWQGFLQAGVPLAGGTDYPIEVITPLWGLQREVTRQELDGTPEGGWLPEGGLNLHQALESLTWGPAYAAREDNRGRIAVGNVADFTAVRENLFSMDPSQIASSTIVLTVTNGKITFQGEQSYPPQ